MKLSMPNRLRPVPGSPKGNKKSMFKTIIKSAFMEVKDMLAIPYKPFINALSVKGFINFYCISCIIS